MDLIESIKLTLRRKTDAYDDEIQDLINTCKTDLKVSGVEVIEESEPLTKQAIKLYCKGHFGYDENSQKFIEAYEKLKISMALSGDYKAVT